MGISLIREVIGANEPIYMSIVSINYKVSMLIAPKLHPK
jgi:hypothetical protein